MSDNMGFPPGPDQGGYGQGYPPYPGQPSQPGQPGQGPAGGPAYPPNTGYPPAGQGYPPGPDQGYPPYNQGYPPPHGQGYPPPGYGPYGGQPRNGLGVAALVLGVVAILLSWTVIGGILLGVGALVCGFLGRGRVNRQEANNGGMALAGIITGAIGVVIALIVLVASIAFFASEEGRTYVSCLDDAGNNQVEIDRCAREFLG